MADNALNTFWKNDNGTEYADVGGKRITRYSTDDIYDQFGNIDRNKEAKLAQRKGEIKNAGMKPQSLSTDAQTQAIKDTAKEFNTSTENAANLVNRVAGGNASTQGGLEAPVVEKEVQVNDLSDKIDTKKPEIDYEGTKKDIEAYRNVVNHIDDYYKDSLSGTFDDLSSKDKKILALDSLLTSMKNISKARPYMGSIYGRAHEGSDVGDEKSMTQKMLETSMTQGMDRRNKRMTAALDQQIKLANFPSDLKMKLMEVNSLNDVDFAQKKRLMDLEITKYYQTQGIDLDFYGKRAETDVAKDAAIRKNAATAPHRVTGSVSIPGVGSIGVK